MTKPSSNRSTSTQHVSDHTSASSGQNPIQPPTATKAKPENFDTHPCITIKWSPDSASRRRDQVPPVAATGLAARPLAGGAAWL
jgi:hypothetical protein